jgi:hypothetical protein
VTAVTVLKRECRYRGEEGQRRDHQRPTGERRWECGGGEGVAAPGGGMRQTS